MMMYIMIALIVAALGGGFYGGCAIQGSKVEKLQADVNNLEVDLKSCQEINKSNQVVVTSLQDDVKKANKSCTTRINEKNNLIKELMKIDTLQPTGGGNENIGDIGIDPILDRLNQLFPHKT